MKLAIKFSFLLTCVLAVTIGNAQCEYCGQILEKGIFNQYASYSESDLADLYDVLLTQTAASASREQVDGGGSQGAEVGYGAISAGFDSSNWSEVEKQRFELIKTLYAQTSRVSKENRQWLNRKVASNSIVASWEKCILNCPNKGIILKSDGDSQGNEFIVSVEWIPSNQIEADNVSGITVENLQVTNGTISDDGTLTSSSKLYPFSSLITKVTRINPDNDVVFTMSTDKYGAQSKVINKVVPDRSNDLPVGTIIQSVLQYKDFTALNSQPQEFGEESIWAPCDGRRVPINARYRIYADNVPDLRGSFTRGLNDFLINDAAVSPLASDRKDPDGDGRLAGSFQGDTFKSHSHNYTKTGGFGYQTGEPKFEFNGSGGGPSYTQTATDASGGSETRPRNVAVYYYVKIN